MQRLAEGEHRETSRPQLGVREHRGMRAAVVHDVLVYLIGQH
jgi:hypothetical protein